MLTEAPPAWCGAAEASRATVLKYNTARTRLVGIGLRKPARVRLPLSLQTSPVPPDAQSADLPRCRRTAPLGPKIAEPFEHMRPTQTPMQTLTGRRRLGSAWNALLRFFDCSQSRYSAKYQCHRAPIPACYLGHKSMAKGQLPWGVQHTVRYTELVRDKRKARGVGKALTRPRTEGLCQS